MIALITEISANYHQISSAEPKLTTFNDFSHH